MCTIWVPYAQAMKVQRFISKWSKIDKIYCLYDVHLHCLRFLDILSKRMGLGSPTFFVVLRNENSWLQACIVSNYLGHKKNCILNFK